MLDGNKGNTGTDMEKKKERERRVGEKKLVDFMGLHEVQLWKINLKLNH